MKPEQPSQKPMDRTVLEVRFNSGIQFGAEVVTGLTAAKGAVMHLTPIGVSVHHKGEDRIVPFNMVNNIRVE